MERLKRLVGFWRWLPAFRVVAETEHLRESSKILDVSPSALSRTINLMEENVGVDLFHREGRGLQLTRAGQMLLESVRAAMRVVDDGLSQATSKMFSGTLRVSSYTQWTAPISDAMLSLQGQHPELAPYLYSHSSDDVNPKLLRGELDVAFVDNPLPADSLSITDLIQIPNGIYCGAGHTLWDTKDPDLEAILGHRFIAPVPDPRGHSADQWPRGLERQVRMFIGDLKGSLDVCQRGELLAVLPDNLVHEAVAAGRLRRLPVDVIPPTSMYAVRRQQLVEGDLAQHMIAAARRAMEATVVSPGSTGPLA